MLLNRFKQIAALFMTMVLCMTLFFASCDKKTESVEPALNSFERWLLQNYVMPYDIQVYYKLDDIETDVGFDYTSYTITSAKIEKAKQMAWLLKHLWLEAYEEVSTEGTHFVRTNTPRIMHFIGSSTYQSGLGTILAQMATAENGFKP